MYSCLLIFSDWGCSFVWPSHFVSGFNKTLTQIQRTLASVAWRSSHFRRRKRRAAKGEKEASGEKGGRPASLRRLAHRFALRSRGFAARFFRLPNLLATLAKQTHQCHKSCQICSLYLCFTMHQLSFIKFILNLIQFKLVQIVLRCSLLFTAALVFVE